MDHALGTVVVVEDDAAQRTLIERWLEAEGHQVEPFEDGESCLRGLARTLPDVVCLDLRLPGIGGLETLERIRSRHPRLAVIMLTADDTLEPVVSAIRLGAYEYLRKPLDRQKLLTTVRNAVLRSRMELRLAQLQHEVEGWTYPNILGRSEAMRTLFRQMDRVAPTDVSVLVHGESGTGKELVARALHQSSGRRDGPFVAVNCAAIPESLQESELFGHERGAFTGATARRAGRFEQADGGTLFLDEVGELSPGLQAKLLRAVQEQRFFRVGGNDEVASDFRLLTATHRDLAREVREGRFREDLFFRVAVLELQVPPLRERGSDIALLASTFARDLGLEVRNRPAQLSAEALDLIASYGWPGNVRELRNAIHGAVVLSGDRAVGPADLPAAVRPSSGAGPGEDRPFENRDDGTPTDAAAGSWADAVPDLALAEVERAVISTMIRRHDGNLSAVARVLDLSRSTLYRKMDAYGIDRTGRSRTP